MPPTVVQPTPPAHFVDSTYVPPTGATITVPSGGNLQDALDTAQPGDEIVVDAGGTYNNNYNFPVKALDGYINIRTSGIDSLPDPGTRVGPAHAGAMARLLALDYTQPAIATMPGSKYFRLIGIEATVAPGIPINYGLIRLGDVGSLQNTDGQVPHHLVLDRCFIHAPPEVNCQRGVTLNSAWTAVVDSYISDIHGAGFDTQAVGGWNGPGPFKIVNNHLEAAGENVLFGGADPNVPNLTPSDIEIRYNHIYKPLAWKQTAWTIKNLFELKHAKRVWFEANILENSWIQAQNGVGILMQALTDNNSAPWTTVQDVLVKYCIVKNVNAGLNINSRVAYGSPPILPLNPSKRISIQHVLIDKMGADSLFTSYNDLEDYSIVHCTGFGGLNALSLDGTPGVRFVMIDSIVTHGTYGFFGSGFGEGLPALNHYVPGFDIEKNVLAGGFAPSNYPPDNHFVATAEEIGFVDYPNGDYSLGPSSPFKGLASDATDPGPDFAALTTALTGVVVGTPGIEPPPIEPPVPPTAPEELAFLFLGPAAVSTNAGGQVPHVGIVAQDTLHAPLPTPDLAVFSSNLNVAVPTVVSDHIAIEALEAGLAQIWVQSGAIVSNKVAVLVNDPHGGKGHNKPGKP